MSKGNLVHLFGEPRITGRQPTPYEARVEWQKRRYELITAAVAAGEWAYSHRQASHDRHQTRIGRYASVVLAHRPGETAESRFAVRSGWNFKLLPGSGRFIQYHPEEDYKLCSEPDAIMQAIAEKYYTIYGLVLFSDNMQPEDVSGIFNNIQHPCYDCREFLGLYLLPSSPVLVVRHRLPCDVFAYPRAEFWGNLIIENWTFDEICKEHRHDTLTGRR
jgi:hypothetical protein